MTPFRTRISKQAKLDNGSVHFFLDDFRFESVWNKPENSLQALKKFRTVLSPDFSLYRDWPLAIQLWNTYRSRWMGRFWQAHGFTVIPTISWSTEESYAFAFIGVETGSVVAISACGIEHVHNQLDYDLFMAGYKQMIQVIQPTAVLCYGRPPAICANYADVWIYPTQWTNIRAMRKAGSEKLAFNRSQYSSQIICSANQSGTHHWPEVYKLVAHQERSHTNGW